MQPKPPQMTEDENFVQEKAEATKPEDELIAIPPPVLPEVKEEEQRLPTCTLTVRCDEVLQEPDKLPKEKAEIIPKNGIIFAEKNIPFAENESVFDILQREMREHHIHMEYVKNPMYASAYIEGIANLYEFDCGDTSGWMYAVNGKIPTYGCSQYILQDGDDVVFFYRCSLY